MRTEKTTNRPSQPPLATGEKPIDDANQALHSYNEKADRYADTLEAKNEERFAARVRMGALAGTGPPGGQQS